MVNIDIILKLLKGRIVGVVFSDVFDIDEVENMEEVLF